MKKTVSVLLVCGMLCAALLTMAGCGKQLPYEEVFDMIEGCDISSVGSSANILKIDYSIRNWIKENATDARSMRGIEDKFSKYTEEMTDDQKAEFGRKCQCVIVADSKISPESDVQLAMARVWGVDVQNYSEDNMAAINEFFSVLDGQLTKAQIKSDLSKSYPPSLLNPDAETAFDRAYFLDLVSSIANPSDDVDAALHQRDIDTASLMDFVVENAKAKDEEVLAGVEECYGLLTVTDRLQFDWNFISIVNNTDTFRDYPEGLEDLGISVDLNKYSDKKRDKLVGVVSDVSGVPYLLSDAA